MIDAAALLKETRELVKDLVDDLRRQAESPEERKRLDDEWESAKAAGRTALGRSDWEAGWLAQVAVAWVLAAVFVRFCEDNGLVPEAQLGGAGERLAEARQRRADYLISHPAHDDRHWLTHVFEQFRHYRTTAALFSDRNPMWLMSPSADGAWEVVGLFTDPGPGEAGSRHDFTDPAWGTRFLGDLYQDLSEHAKKQFALLQTPEFVEEFILDRALTPAIGNFGIDTVTLIDPTCGSGHFLLGAFERISRGKSERHPHRPKRDIAQQTLSQIAGVDINPFAVAVARFRLMLAAMRFAGETTLAATPAYETRVVVGDSLLHGDRPGRLVQLLGDDQTAAQRHGYAYEDIPTVEDLLTRRWHVVVGNPPYITPKDPALNGLYRERFSTCHRQYSLGIPFTEQFFWLAAHGPEHGLEQAGYVGMITANSFMKREFGKKLIEEHLPTLDLTHVIDTSGAYIPGHGTPTVILLGRHRRPVADTVRSVLGIRGEPSRPADAWKGFVWTSIIDHIDEPGSETPFVSVVDTERANLKSHPWSIGGGGASELKAFVDGDRPVLRAAIEPPIGRSIRAGADEAFLANDTRVRHSSAAAGEFPMLVIGEEVRDWSNTSTRWIWYPYASMSPVSAVIEQLWPLRRILSARSTFQGDMASAGLEWWEYMQHTPSAYRTPLSIVFAFVATHNHFVLDRGGKVFKQTAPVIKLPEGASEDDHLALLGVLNSSTACFWMKQVFHDRGNGGHGGGIASDEWERFFEHDGTKLQQFPLPAGSAHDHGRRLDALAQRLASQSPAALCRGGTPSADALAAAKIGWHTTLAEMIAAQEELDWHVYSLYGLAGADLTHPNPPTLALGERAFEIVLARKVVDGEEETSWFTRHRSTPITELPAHWPDDYRAMVERRIELIGADRNIGLIERPECKRRWNTEPWDSQQAAALKRWLLDRLETPRYWPAAEIVTVNRLASIAQLDADFVSVAALYAGRADVDIPALVGELVAGEAVAFAAAARYTETGLHKRAEWEAVWELQRAEDRGEDVGPIPKPPEYKSTDFIGVGWTHRGKLDVPKERFISYAGLERPGDPSPAVGWAGWDHLQRAQALVAFHNSHTATDRDRAIPVLVGLVELEPWVRQWHNSDSPDPSQHRIGDALSTLIAQFLRTHQITREDLAAWRPPLRSGRRHRRTP